MFASMRALESFVVANKRLFAYAPVVARIRGCSYTFRARSSRGEMLVRGTDDDAYTDDGLDSAARNESTESLSTLVDATHVLSFT
jgi:hypothetical protein|mmetsp:Transcript_6832/g.22865  ORF Transcript_6832/g.22865 Transcript_6832/m.22865 type:complete len:85 (-) Transcript_6832:24-278(-)